MTNLPANIQARRAIEDRAAKLGVRRTGYETALASNTQDIIDLLRDAKGSGVPYDQLAALLGVSRQSIYNWREIGDQIPPGETAAQWAAKRTAKDHTAH